MLGGVWRRGGGESGTLVCVGSSHVVAVARAAREAGADLRAINLWDFEPSLVPCAGSVRLNPAVARAIGKRYRWMFSMVGGNVHNVLGFARHPRPFDFVLPDEPDRPLDADAEIIPYESIKAVLTRRMEFVFLQLQGLATLARGRLTHVESPPPVPQRKMPPWIISANENFARSRISFAGSPGTAPTREAIEKYGMALPSLRYRMWRLNGEVMRGFCERLGVAYLPAPRQSIGPRGFMLPRFVGDATHGNSLYGAMVLAQMTAALE